MPARVVDVKRAASFNDRFMVDANTWLNMTYFGSVITGADAGFDEAQFALNCVREGGELLYAPSTIFEIANVIERTEFKKAETNNSDLQRKEFRRKSENRKRLQERVHDTWERIKRYGNLAHTSFTLEMLNAVVQRVYPTYAIDSYDCAYILSMHQNGIERFISADTDFASIDGMILYTADSRVIESAKKDGRLIKG